MYFTNKKFTIEKEKLSIINSLFSQYDEAKLGRISPKDARLILRELGIESLDAQKIVAKADPERRSLIKYEIFVETLRIHLGETQAKMEMTQVFEAIRILGGQPERAKMEFMRTGKKSVPTINRDEIYKSAVLLKEALTEEDVKEMMDFAEHDSDPRDKYPGQLTLEKFLRLMAKTSIW